MAAITSALVGNNSIRVEYLADQLLTILESTTDGVIMLDPSLSCIYLNSPAETLLGPGQSPLGKPLWDLMPHLARTQLEQTCRQALEESRPVLVECYDERGDRWVEVRAFPAAQGISIFIRDVTDRHRAEQALKERETHLKLAQEAGQIGTWEWNVVTGAQVWSDNMFALYGWDREGPPPDHAEFMEIVHPDDRFLVEAATQALLNSEKHYDTEFRIVRPDGSIRWLVGRSRLIRDSAGKPYRVYGVNYDVTESREIAERLADAKRVAEQASKAKTEFLAIMSHEIRTPLNGILGHTDLLLDQNGLTASQRRHAERIQTAGSALLTVVNDILDFSKIEAGQVELELQPFSLRALADSAAAIVKGLVDQKQLAFHLVLDPKLADKVVGDEHRLRQVLLNLLNNAIKFTPHGTIEFTIRPEPGPSGDYRVRFVVRDTGIGIPKDKQDRLFRQFSQVDGSDRRRFGGTGLGLAISKRLIELMGGTIEVDSDVGRGSTFWFTVTLPVAEVEPYTMAIPKPEVFPRKTARILLVEDNDINQEIARSMLVAAGHEVDLARDGSEAVMAVQSQVYDLVLMDMQMPVMDGLSATRHIRALPGEERSIPIIAMTANVLPPQIQAALHSGMDGHIGKPFKRSELLSVIDQWMSGHEREHMHPMPDAGLCEGATILT